MVSQPFARAAWKSVIPQPCRSHHQRSIQSKLNILLVLNFCVFLHKPPFQKSFWKIRSFLLRSFYHRCSSHCMTSLQDENRGSCLFHIQDLPGIARRYHSHPDIRPSYFTECWIFSSWPLPLEFPNISLSLSDPLGTDLPIDCCYAPCISGLG